MAWIACLADARSTETYARWLTEAGLTISVMEPHDNVPNDLVRDIGIRLLATDVLSAVTNVDVPDFDFEAVKRMTQQARRAIERGEPSLFHTLSD